MDARRDDGVTPLRVLFLCTENAARSQIAEALLRKRGRGRFEVASAGTAPAPSVRPEAVEALRRSGTEWGGRRPTDVRAVVDEEWDLVISVCDKAREACPRFPRRPVTAYWDIPDPTLAQGYANARAAAFWDVLTLLSRRIDLLCALPDEKLRRLALRTAVERIAEADERGDPGGVTCDTR